MVAVEIIHDGWTRRSVGAKGVILRRNPDHIQRCVTAIRQRYETEVEIYYEISGLRGSGRVVPLEVGRRK